MTAAESDDRRIPGLDAPELAAPTLSGRIQASMAEDRRADGRRISFGLRLARLVPWLAWGYFGIRFLMILYALTSVSAASGPVRVSVAGFSSSGRVTGAALLGCVVAILEMLLLSIGAHVAAAVAIRVLQQRNETADPWPAPGATPR